MALQILGIDPGGTTGVALVIASEAHGAEVVDSWQLPFEETPAFFNSMLSEVDVVAMEKYVISGRTVKASRQYEALYVIGGVLFLCSLLGDSAPDVNLQTPATAKNAWDNDRLKAEGHKVTGPHAKDAVRHALLRAQLISAKA